MAANLTSKRQAHLVATADICEEIAALIGKIRKHYADAKSQNFTHTTLGVVDADFTGGLEYADAAMYRAALIELNDLLTYWDDVGNANGNPDKKMLAMTRR